MNKAFLQKLNDIIDANIGNTMFGAKDLSEKMGMSPSSLLRKVRSSTGKSITQYIREVRLKKALKILKEEDVTVSEVAFRLGFNSPSYFAACFKKYCGYLPGDIKKYNGNGLNHKQDDEILETIDLQVQLNQTERKGQGEKIKKTQALLISAILVVLIISGSLLIPGLLKPSEPNIKSIAVLPFELLGDDSTKQYWADGMLLAVNQKLGEISDLRVIPGTTMNQYRGTRKTLKAIGRELKADYLVAGGILMYGDSINLILTLNHAKRQEQVWEANYLEEWADIFTVQSKVSQEIAAEIKVFVSPQQKLIIERPPTTNLSAYDYYILGNDYARRSTTKTDILDAIKMYRRAVEIDSAFALAWAGLAGSSGDLFWFGYDISAKNLELTKEYLDRALSLGSDLKEVLIEEAHYYYRCKYDYKKSLKILEKLKHKYPNYSEIYAYIGNNYRRLGEFSKGLENLDIAISLNPAYWYNYYEAANELRLQRLPNSKNAEKYYLKAIDLNPSNLAIHSKILDFYYERGEIRKVKDHLKIHGNFLNSFYVESNYALIEYYSRNYDKAIEIIKQLPDQVHWRLRTKHFYLGFFYRAKHDNRIAVEHFQLYRDFLLSKIRGLERKEIIYRELGIVYAALGEKNMAIESYDKSWDMFYERSYNVELTKHWSTIYKVRILVLVEEYDQALKELDQIMKTQSVTYIEYLKFDPFWDPLRDHEKFQEIISNPDYQLDY